MPCDMGMSSGELALSEARDNERKTKTLESRVAFLEQSICGLCQQLEYSNVQLHPQLKQWFEDHKKQPGCEAK